MRVVPPAPRGDLLSKAEALLARRKPDWRGYFRALAQCARAGDPRAQEALGAWLLEGARDRSGKVMLRRSPGRAVALLRAAAAAGLDVAQFRLACCYDVGEGVARDPTEARRLYRLASRQGLAVAAANMAVLCRECGDSRARRRWLRRAVVLGDIDAEVELARLELGSRCGPDRRRYWRGRLRKIAKTRTPEGEDAAALLEELGE